MQIITKDELLIKKDLYYTRIFQGNPFVYPTDTLYAFGCIATDSGAIAKIREAKQRPERPFSVIAPNKEWIRKNCFVDAKAEEWLNKLPGPYTLILKVKNPDCIANNVNPTDDTLGIRMPAHWMLDVVAELKEPLITPSANVTGMNVMTSSEDISKEIKNASEFMVDDGVLDGTPSTIVNLSFDKEKITERK